MSATDQLRVDILIAARTERLNVLPAVEYDCPAVTVAAIPRTTFTVHATRPHQMENYPDATRMRLPITGSVGHPRHLGRIQVHASGEAD